MLLQIDRPRLTTHWVVNRGRLLAWREKVSRRIARFSISRNAGRENCLTSNGLGGPKGAQREKRPRQPLGNVLRTLGA